jgi:hypothetical protein
MRASGSRRPLNDHGGSMDGMFWGKNAANRQYLIFNYLGACLT